MKRETLKEEKERMINEWVYFRNSKGEIEAVQNRRTLVSLYGARASFVLSYMRKIHGVSLIPVNV